MAVSRSGELSLLDPTAAERERYKLPYGAVIMSSDHARVSAGDVVANWDPTPTPIVTEVAVP